MVNDDETKTTEPRSYQLRVIRELRKMGACKVRVGDIEAEWTWIPPQGAMPEMPPDAAPRELTQEEHDKIAFWSAP